MTQQFTLEVRVDVLDLDMDNVSLLAGISASEITVHIQGKAPRQAKGNLLTCHESALEMDYRLAHATFVSTGRGAIGFIHRLTYVKMAPSAAITYVEYHIVASASGRADVDDRVVSFTRFTARVGAPGLVEERLSVEGRTVPGIVQAIHRSLPKAWHRVDTRGQYYQHTFKHHFKVQGAS